MTGDAVVQQVGGRPKVSWWQVLRVVLVLGWVAWAGLTWWTAPREGSVSQARADLDAGRVTSYEWGDSWENTGGLLNPAGAELDTADEYGPIFLWNTRDDRTHYTYTNSTLGSDGKPVDAESKALGAAMEHWYAGGPYAGTAVLKTVLSGLAITGVLLVLWALTSAPDPVTGTKWFWFWILYWTPLGLGLLVWLLRERPWSSRAAPREKRYRWYAGMGFAFLGGLLLSVVVWGLHSLFGDQLVPSLGA
ncbi:hypothetical protein [Actinoplanes friuliensis]|uniref:Uncharacterized protein n=1 Tax=Actinoplanes friuliensis DSM 7358 TaxID=1246995 RepID=U5VW30_9ACTN|nr:hypothetical protein [Actinoplanes friuliensis]AGZ39866.1 hypothetical protein AFR_07885 [Actinoplanes friuliensis DSM 7358]